MKFKKLITVMLVSMMTVSSLASCGNTASESSSSASGTTEKESTSTAVESSDTASSEDKGITFPLEEKLTFTVLCGSTSSEFPMADNIALNYTLENANIEFELTDVLVAELTEKRNLLIASGDYPDVFFKSGLGNDADKYGTQGIFIPLEDLMREYAPNFCRVMDETDGWQWITAADGHVYSFPDQDELIPKAPFWINKRWLDNLGLEEPTSYDELYEVLKAFKEKDANGNGDPNDEVPFACTVGAIPALMAYQDYIFDWDTKLAIIDGEITYAYAHESYKEFITFAKKLYDEGLVNEDLLTVKKADLRTQGKAADIYGMINDHGAFQSVGEERHFDFILLTPFEEDVFVLRNPYNRGALAITDACENPEVIVAWADQFFTEEGGIIKWLGLEGETYEVDADGNWYWIYDKGHGEDINSVRNSATLFYGQKFPGIQPEFYNANMAVNGGNEVDVALTKERAKIVPLSTHFPCLNLTEGENAELAPIKTDINGYAAEFLVKVLSGELELEENWDEYVNMLKQMGLDRMLAIYNTAYERNSK